MKKIILFVFCFPFLILGQDVEVRVADVGAGLCAIIKLPNNKFIIYDAGNKSRAQIQIDDMLDKSSEIEYLILSHTDDDHWGATEYIVNNYKVKNVLKTDYRHDGKPAGAYKSGVAAIKKKKVNKIKLSELKPGATIYDEDGIKLLFICGFEEPLEEWGDLGASKLNNGVSIVVKLIVGDKSVLICGDAVGKDDNYKSKKCTPREECIATEKFMLDNTKETLASDVIIAPHHGADNASCEDFIKAVSPKYVVFSCGDKHVHPRHNTVKRYLDSGVDEKDIYRTDYFDKAESGTLECNKEWKHKRKNGRGDDNEDDVQILIKDGKVKVKYLYP